MRFQWKRIFKSKVRASKYQAVRSVKRILGIVKRAFTFSTKVIILLLRAWISLPEKDTDRIGKVQRATTVMPDLKNYKL